jgi:hypothetical protein
MATAQQPWYKYGTTRRYTGNTRGGEVGIDVGTPEGTPLFFPYGGTVEAATYGAPGGFIAVLANIPGIGRITEYLLHLDQVLVKPGDTVAAGQLVGYSGGEVGGPTTTTRHPASPNLSGGPHTEFGLFQETDLSNNHWWAPGGGTIDPTGLLGELRAGTASGAAYELGSTPAPAGVTTGGGPNWWQIIVQGITGSQAAGQDVAGVPGPGQLAQAVGDGITNIGGRVAIGGAGAVLILFGLVVVVVALVKEEVESPEGQAAIKAAGTAAKAAA